MENETKNSPKKVLITGCSSGFGLLTAVEAAREGFDVIATMRNLDKSGPLKDALEKAGRSATIDQLDVTDPDSIQQIARKYSPIDILINNAGILIMGSFLELTETEQQRVFETNYFGPVKLIRAFAPGMIEKRSGRIVNVASLAGIIGHPFNSAYGASKHALVGFSRSIRVELAPFGIDVVSVEPGYHKTEIIRTNAQQSENFYDRSSPMFEWNRGFLRGMMEEIIPRAADPEMVARCITEIICCEKPKHHYVIGKDAFFASALKRLGLTPWLERKIAKKISKFKRLENQREAEKKNKRKKRKSAE